MRISHTCACGASCTFEDARGHYINAGRTPDEHGDLMLVERWARQWLAVHRAHDQASRLIALAVRADAWRQGSGTVDEMNNAAIALCDELARLAPTGEVA